MTKVQKLQKDVVIHINKLNYAPADQNAYRGREDLNMYLMLLVTCCTLELSHLLR